MSQSEAATKGASISLKRLPGNIVSTLFGFLMTVIERILDPIQRLLGVNKMGYVFLLPNMLIFSIFVLVPMMLNFYYRQLSNLKSKMNQDLS